jgi:hypothetical protein
LKPLQTLIFSSLLAGFVFANYMLTDRCLQHMIDGEQKYEANKANRPVHPDWQNKSEL